MSKILRIGDHPLRVGTKILRPSQVDPYNPLRLPPFTIRCKFRTGRTPVFAEQVLVDAEENIWDVTRNDESWRYLFISESEYLLEVLGANTTGVKSMEGLFNECAYMTSIPPFDLSTVTNMDYMFFACLEVAGGALSMYNQASSLPNVPSHYRTFTGCGESTTTGAAELAQIPSDWK